MGTNPWMLSLSESPTSGMNFICKISLKTDFLESINVSNISAGFGADFLTFPLSVQGREGEAETTYPTTLAGTHRTLALPPRLLPSHPVFLLERYFVLGLGLTFVRTRKLEGSKAPGRPGTHFPGELSTDLLLLSWGQSQGQDTSLPKEHRGWTLGREQG